MSPIGFCRTQKAPFVSYLPISHISQFQLINEDKLLHISNSNKLTIRIIRDNVKFNCIMDLNVESGKWFNNELEFMLFQHQYAIVNSFKYFKAVYFYISGIPLISLSHCQRFLQSQLMLINTKGLRKIVNCRFFSRNKKSKGILDMQNVQQKIFKKYAGKFSLPGMFQHEDILMEQEVYGKKCHITGLTINNYESTTYIKDVIGHLAPKHIVIGTMSESDVPPFKGKTIKSSGDRFQSVRMFCKAELTEYEAYLRQNDPYLYLDHENRHYFRTQRLQQRISADDNLTIIYNSLFDENCKMSYGKPSDLIVFEDLILNNSLQQLESMLDRTLAKIKERYASQMMHQGSILTESIRWIALSEEPSLFSKQITYTTSLFRKYAKTQYNLLLFVPLPFVRQIADMIHHLDVTLDPDNIYRNFLNERDSQNYKNLHRIINSKLIDQVLNKIAVLSLLISNTLQRDLLIFGKQIFQKSIFSPLFRDVSVQNLAKYYISKKTKYSNKVFDILAQRLKNIGLHYPQDFGRMSLKQQLETVDKRFQEISYGYIPNNSQIQESYERKLEELHKKMKSILINQGDQNGLDLLDRHLNGRFCKDSIILYSKMIGRANVQMKQKLRIPAHHFVAFKGLYKDYYRDQILKIDSFQRQEQSAKNPQKQLQNFSHKFKVITDPRQAFEFIDGKKGQLIDTIQFEDEEGQHVLRDKIDSIYKKLKEKGAFEK